MQKAAEVAHVMKSLGTFSEKELASITDESLAQMEKEAQPVPEGQFPQGVKPLSQIWTGNNFRIANGMWWWQDQPGSQCGRARWWHYPPRVGDSYSVAGNCPQGYPWYRFDIMH